MAYLKTLQPPHQIFSTKPSSSSSTSAATTSITTMKSIKALIHSLIVAHICRAFRALRRVKSILLQALKNHKNLHHHFPYLITGHHNNKNQKKVFFGSFRLHYNWGSTSSSHVLPVPESVLRGCSSDPQCFYDGNDSSSSSSSYVEGSGTAAQSSSQSTLAGYLLWLEEKDREVVNNNNKCGGGGEEEIVNEIDRLAEMFIADCHEKFQLEKQESLRRFHEMLARSM